MPALEDILALNPCQASNRVANLVVETERQTMLSVTIKAMRHRIRKKSSSIRFLTNCSSPSVHALMAGKIGST
jgi:hypothetical protein